MFIWFRFIIKVDKLIDMVFFVCICVKILFLRLIVVDLVGIKLLICVKNMIKLIYKEKSIYCESSYFIVL